MINKQIIITLTIFFFANIITWFQLNGQFFSPWFKNNPLLLCLFGIPISWLYIVATKYSFVVFDELLWPGRFVGFVVGIIIFALFTAIFLGEGINNKTIVSLVLSLVLVSIQVFWR